MYMEVEELLELIEESAFCNWFQVMYNLAEWCSSKASGLAMIGIANTLDLPERLHPKIKR